MELKDFYIHYTLEQSMNWKDSVLEIVNQIATESENNIKKEIINKLEIDCSEIEPVQHGYWELINDESIGVSMTGRIYIRNVCCSVCKEKSSFLYKEPFIYEKRCPKCGAKMDKEKVNV